MSELNSVPNDVIVDTKNGFRLTDPWRGWFAKLFFVVSPLGDNGTTALRPTKNLYIGRGYLDLTLGKPIWVKSLNPTVWIDATGATV